MGTVCLLCRHPPYPYNASHHLKAGEVVGVYEDRAEPDRIAAEKNARRPSYLWAVHSKRVKPRASCAPQPADPSAPTT